MRDTSMTSADHPRLTVRWIPVHDAAGRARLEMRWSVADPATDRRSAA